MVNQNMKKGDKQNEEKPVLLFPVTRVNRKKKLKSKSDFTIGQ